MAESPAQKSRRLARKWKKEGKCSHCGGKREDEQYVTCRTCRKGASRTRQRLIKTRDDRGVCRICGKNPQGDGFKTCASCSQREYHYQSDHPENRRIYYKKTRADVLTAYGGRCACCGETESMFLCIDHVDNDGAAHRRAMNNNGGTSMYTWLKARGYPEGFRVLCHNCNIGRHINGGRCPHEDRDIHAALNLEAYPRLVGNDNACGQPSAGFPDGESETGLVEAGTTESAL